MKVIANKYLLLTVLIDIVAMLIAIESIFILLSTGPPTSERMQHYYEQCRSTGAKCRNKFGMVLIVVVEFGTSQRKQMACSSE